MRIESKELTSQRYWDQSYAELPHEIVPTTDRIRTWIETVLPIAAKGEEAIEIGCFPGRYLAVLGTMKYVLHGIDRSPELDRLPGELLAAGYKIGSFERNDFLVSEIENRFDVVCSFGFIEHFTNWTDILRKQAALVNNGGTILVETPNFAGWLQRILHFLLDNENYRRHEQSAMDPQTWALVLEREGFKIDFAGYVGRFEFWRDGDMSTSVKLFDSVVRTLSPILRLFPEGRRFLSPYSVLCARRPPSV
jgi:L-malate glycosyltransferase